MTERPTRPWLGWVLLLAVVAGLGAACVGAWHGGLLVVGIALGLAAALRLLAPRLPLGPLSVRTGWLDATFLSTAGIVLVVAAIALS